MVVYYSSEFLKDNLVQPPLNVLKYLSSVKDLHYNHFVTKCPAITDYYKNVYAIFPTYDYTLTYTNKLLSSKMYNQIFFDSNIYIRLLTNESAHFSYLDPPINFFTEEKSLLMETIMVSLHLNSNKINMLQGCYDIGKHFRKLELPVLIKKDESFIAKREEPLYYVKFNTDKKIEFKRFTQTKELADIVSSILNVRNFTSKYNPLSFYYNLIEKYKLKNKIIQIIKQNLVD